MRSTSPCAGRSETRGATVHVVLDELRASSTIVRLLDRGATAVIPAASLAEARRIARGLGSAAVLVGEHHVVRAPGFDFGNSPAEVARADLAGRTAVLSTRNGTAVLRSLPPDATILVGCLLNASAVARAALALARAQGADVGIVCAGRVGAFAIDDAIAAGAIVTGLLAAAGVDATTCRRRRVDRPQVAAGADRPMRRTHRPDRRRPRRAQLWRTTPTSWPRSRFVSGHLWPGTTWRRTSRRASVDASAVGRWSAAPPPRIEPLRGWAGRRRGVVRMRDTTVRRPLRRTVEGLPPRRRRRVAQPASSSWGR